MSEGPDPSRVSSNEGSDGDSRMGSSPSDALLRLLARAPERALAPRPTDLVGSTVGRFEILGVLGEGGMGVVYRARDVTLGRVVALKALIDPERFPKLRARFEREARAAARVEHSNLATIYDLFEHEGRPFLAMQLVSGQTLRARLARGAPPLDEALAIARGIARGLAAAHEAGVLHRDLKPENVMLEPDGGVRVLDFGLAKLLDTVTPETLHHATALTTEGRILGTLSYMSPEQTRGAAIDARSDVFSFGAVLHEITTGKKAFGRPTTEEIVRAIQQESPSFQASAPAAPAWLAAVIARCLEKDPAARFASGREVALALARPRRRETKPPRARARAFASALVLVLALGLGALFAVHLIDSRAPGCAVAPPPP